MTLITRVSRLFQADMHAVLDKIEEPEQLLKQSIREMQEFITADERQLRCWQYEQQQLTLKQEQQTKTLTELDDKLSFCFKSDKDDLARSFIKQKLEIRQASLLLAEKTAVLTEKLTRLTRRLEDHQSQLASLRQKAEAFLDEDRDSSANWENAAFAARNEDIEIAFLYEKQKWSQS